MEQVKVYLLIIEDRHTDVEVQVYLELDHAIALALDYLYSHARYRGMSAGEYYGLDEDQSERMNAGDDYIIRYDPPRPGGLHLLASYSPEGDYVTVKETLIVDAEEEHEMGESDE